MSFFKTAPTRHLIVFYVLLSLMVLLGACSTLSKSTGIANLPAFPYNIQKQALGSKYMVVSAHPIASAVGCSILEMGGNAVDAAAAVQFALAVVYPQAGNIGGGGFMVYRSHVGKVVALDYREKAPAAAHRDMYLNANKEVIPELSTHGHLSAGVPGSVAGIWESHQKYGKLSWAKIVQPAIDLATLGFLITPQEAVNLNDERSNFERLNTQATAFVKKEPWKAGDRLLQPDLARTLRRISSDGHRGFYEGWVAQKIVEEMKRGKGLITQRDLLDYKAVWRTPISFKYKNYELVSMPPPSSGGILLQQMLGMIEPYPLNSYGFQSPEAVHLMTEVERRAFADRAAHMGDADFWKVPVVEMTQAAYLKARMQSFSMEKAGDTISLKTGIAPYESEETTHLSIVDAEGNAVSVTTTLNYTYGSRVVVGGAGFILNDEMDDFSAKPGSPNVYGLVGGKANAIEPGKRMLSSMTPTIVSKNGRLDMILGTPGGSTIPTSVFQVFLNVAEFGLPLSEAVQAKRFHHQYIPDVIHYEEGALAPATLSILQQKGHELKQRSPIGRVEAIRMRADGKIEGVADNRGDDHAQGK